MILPPDYLVQFKSFKDIVMFLIQFHVLLIVYMVMNIAVLVAVSWSLLFVFRALGIPWVDGTTKGFLNRKKDV
jgi:hypothetical protein